MCEESAATEPVLIAEDDLTSRTMLEMAVRKLGYCPQSVSNGILAWEALRTTDGPCMALIDWEMPEMNGLDLIKKVRSELHDRFVYLIMVTAKSAKEEILEGIAQGADDYIVKPFDPKELKVRMRAGQRIVDLQRKLVAANRGLERQAKTDNLTGFYNRQALQSDFKPHDARVASNPASMCLIMADIDRFKRVNDTHGHDAGDSVLRQFSERLRSQLRQGDTVYRMGGEEFLLIAPGTDETVGVGVAERIRLAVEQRPFRLPDGGMIHVTCSFGVSAVTAVVGQDDIDASIKKADDALYQAKEHGRNRVSVARSFGIQDSGSRIGADVYPAYLAALLAGNQIECRQIGGKMVADTL